MYKIKFNKYNMECVDWRMNGYMNVKKFDFVGVRDDVLEWYCISMCCV